MQALILLAKLPMRNPTDLAVVQAVYMMALEGVTAFGLEQATKAIVRGSLGHPFMPSPPELRLEIDRIMDAEHDKLARTRRLEWDEDRQPTSGPPDEEARQRMNALWQTVRPMFEPPKPDESAKFKTNEDRLADLAARANEPFDVTPALLRNLARRRKEDRDEATA